MLIAATVIGLIAAAVIWQRNTMIVALPRKIVCASQEEARIKAGPTALPVLGTGSMYPFLPITPIESERMKTIVAYAVPCSARFDEIKRGDLVSYWADWAQAFVLHQAASKDSGGWIMTGLNNARSESFARVTPKNFCAIISEVYVWEF